MDKILLDLINKNKYELVGEGFISKSYRFIINSKKYILLQGQISDSYSCYLQSYKNIKFSSPFIKSLKTPNEELTLIEPQEKNIFLKYGAMIYKEIEGLIFSANYLVKINNEKISNKLSLFVNELFSIPVNISDISKAKDKIIREFKSDIEIIKNYFYDKNIEQLIYFEKDYLEYIKDFNDFHYIHGDLWEENMIISYDYQELIGVVDFDNFSIGDIAKDYASLLNLGFDFVNILIDKNEKCFKDKNDFIKRIKLYQKKIEIEDLAYILKDNNLKWRINSKIENLKELGLI